MQSALLEPTADGITIGAAASNRFRITTDPSVDLYHATLESTNIHGIWVFVDHSRKGSFDGQRALVHRQASIVSDGDTFVLGNTQLQVHFYTPVADAPLSPVRPQQVSSIAPEYTNSPVPKYKRAQNRPTEFSLDPLHFSKVNNQALPFEYSASPPTSSAMGRFAQTKPIPSRRDDLRIQVSKKMANLNQKPTSMQPPLSPPVLRAGRHGEMAAPRPDPIVSAGYALEIERRQMWEMTTLISATADDDCDDVRSSVESNAPTEVAKYRDSIESLSGDESDYLSDESLPASPKPAYPPPSDVRHMKPNTPPRHDDDLPHRLIASLRLKRLQNKAPPRLDALLSPYKSAKQRLEDPLQFYMESPREPSSYFDYSMHETY
ncbi:hypothetical protein ACHHYP_04792 [Achlya hypogyna]|uniref:FHA domain-containing protein n=1 Tax=Achlya hypogyna TaxID=1202772 RepID=A0A1V9Z0C2_ACHHY|nr:hypothetical protein ACHHYP_04792 [Achlya hypogyna]